MALDNTNVMTAFSNVALPATIFKPNHNDLVIILIVHFQRNEARFPLCGTFLRDSHAFSLLIDAASAWRFRYRYSMDSCSAPPRWDALLGTQFEKKIIYLSNTLTHTKCTNRILHTKKLRFVVSMKLGSVNGCCADFSLPWFHAFSSI